MTRILLTACCLLAAAVLNVSADEKSCCFSPTFTMDGRFTLTINATDRNRPDRYMNLNLHGTLKSMADFPNEKFAAIGSLIGGFEADKKESASGNGNLTMIMDANDETPRVYGKVRFNTTSQRRNRVNNDDFAGCMVSAVENIDRIPDYQCVPKKIFRGGDVKDGLIEMLLPDDLPIPEVIENALKIFFDQATCTPSKISFHHEIKLRRGVSAQINFNFDADNKVGHSDMPEIPDDVSTCKERGVSRIASADQVKGLLGLAVMMAGIQ